jgi:drug/metabolite transporter (DMT)-like permease
MLLELERSLREALTAGHLDEGTELRETVHGFIAIQSIVNCILPRLSLPLRCLSFGRMARTLVAAGARAQGAALSARLPAGLLGVAFVSLWSTGYPAARIALDHSGPFTLLVLRFTGAGLIFAALAWLGGAAWPRGRAALHSALVGALTLGLQFSTLYWAAARGVNVGLIALIVGTMPIVTALLARAFLDEAVRPLQWLGFAFGLSGVALAVGEGIGAGGGAGSGAYLAVVVGLLALSVGTVYQKRHASNVDPRSGLALQHLAAAVPLLPFAFHEGLRFDASGEFFASLGWVIGVNSLGAFALLFVLLRRGAVNQVATLFFLMPPATAVMDYFVLGDELTALKVAGVVIAALGVFLATRPRPPAAQLANAALRDRAPHAAAHRSCPAPCE